MLICDGEKPGTWPSVTHNSTEQCTAVRQASLRPMNLTRNAIVSYNVADLKQINATSLQGHIAPRLRVRPRPRLRGQSRKRCFRGPPLSTSAPRGRRGSKNRPILRTNSLTEVRTRGGRGQGVQKCEKFVDVLNGSPLRAQA